MAGAYDLLRAALAGLATPAYVAASFALIKPPMATELSLHLAPPRVAPVVYSQIPLPFQFMHMPLLKANCL